MSGDESCGVMRPRTTGEVPSLALRRLSGRVIPADRLSEPLSEPSGVRCVRGGGMRNSKEGKMVKPSA